MITMLTTLTASIVFAFTYRMLPSRRSPAVSTRPASPRMRSSADERDADALVSSASEGPLAGSQTQAWSPTSASFGLGGSSSSGMPGSALMV